MTFRAFIGALLFMPQFFLTAFGTEPVRSPLGHLVETPSGWRVEYVPPPRTLSPIEINGRTYHRFLEPTPDRPGLPGLPIDAFSFGVPAGSFISAELLEPVFEDTEIYLAPSPHHYIDDELEAVEIFHTDNSAYGLSHFSPQLLVEVQSPYRLRQQMIAVVRVRPYQYNPASGTLRRIVKAQLAVTLHNAVNDEARPESSIPADPHFEEVYRSLLVNYEQARRWRTDIPLTQSHDDSTRSWFETGRQYVKIPIAQDGWYRVTSGQLRSAGVNLMGIDPATIKVFQRGRQLPIVVRPDTAVEFYAFRNYGDSTFIDYFTDTSACWMTWGGADGTRFASSSMTGTASAVIRSALTTVHQERNLGYFSGATTAEIIENGTVPGEGWFWTQFNVNAQAEYPFVLDSIDHLNPSATFRVRVWGSGFGSPPAQHRARFWMNDSLIGDYTFAQREGGVFTAAIPSTWLRSDTNRLRIRNIDTGTPNNRFILDWFEVDYQRRLRAVGNQLLFAVAETGLAELVVGGFSSPEIEIYDLTTKRVLTDVIVAGDSVGGYVAMVHDTVNSPRSYLARGVSYSTDGLMLKSFGDIRANAAGADYIVITHKKFLTHAQQLASHRVARSNVRTVVVDVDDIYDEFNYGVKNGTRIKSFVQYAYANWPLPRPAYLLIVGDANWDHRRYYSNTVKVDYVPAYGFPSSDNWYGCFDSTRPFLSQLMIGRLPVETEAAAQAVVNKIVEYDDYPVSAWNKNILYITGGNNATEQAGFNYLAESSIAAYITPPPLGGTPIRVYKQTLGVIDGENKQRLKAIVKDGVSFIAFTGHSGGRVWGVDMGHPSELENTNGMLPFISTVTCNVGGFAHAANNVLSEDFLVAENRGAIAVWASSSLGYATYGAALTNYWLHNVCFDSVRAFGKLTLYSLNRLWAETGSGYITLAMMNLNPLIGDPLSSFAVPLRPDLAITPAGISTNVSQPTPNDTAVTIRMDVHNYGLVTPDSIGITLTDVYNGSSTLLLSNAKTRPIFHRDSLFYHWNATSKTGLHTFAVMLDPTNGINEVNELNNAASADHYIYTNNLFVVKPLNNAVVPPGAQELVVTSPIGFDAAGFVYQFEVDTVATFDSGARISSGSVSPSAVSGQWTTPPLELGKAYFWRARTVHGTLEGNWVVSSFTTSTDLPIPTDANVPSVRWRQQERKVFARNLLRQTAATDSGVTIAPSTTITIYARSVGFRYNQNLEYYSQLQVNDQRVIGFWWELGNSFMVIRIDEFTGSFVFRNFNTASSAAWSDSMRTFINQTPAGNYLAIAVIFNGQSNVTEGLKLTMDTLGATLFRSIVNGQSYAFIGRKGSGAPGMMPLEQLTNDTAVVRLAVPNFYSLGSGSMTTAPLPVPVSWQWLRWRRSGDFSRTQPRVALVGLRPNGAVDTLRVLPTDSTDVLLVGLNSVTSGPRYVSVMLAALLATTDATTTPRLTDWWLDFAPPADLAVSAQTIGLFPSEGSSSIQLPVTVYNIGYAKSDSVRVVVNALDKYNNSRQVGTTVLDSIAAGGSRSTSISFSILGLARRTRIQVTVSPLRKGRDLIAENNTAYYLLQLPVIVPIGLLRVYADGRELMDNDYVVPTPVLTIRPQWEDESDGDVETAILSVNGQRTPTVSASVLAARGSLRRRVSDIVFKPSLASGANELRFKISRLRQTGEVDSLEHSVTLNVIRESRILNLYNYPNPFARETRFTFVLTGSQPPDHASIKIFTVSGRKIRELSVPQSALQIGTNQVYWDGRDADGDEVANGYYLYQLSVGVDGESTSSTQKFVKAK